jgi:hypothetical protein
VNSLVFWSSYVLRFRENSPAEEFGDLGSLFAYKGTEGFYGTE